MKKYELNGENYLELWKYFQSKAISVKGAMFTTITWLIGFNTALLTFIVVILPDFHSSNLSDHQKVFISGASFAGLLICWLAYIALSESGKRIEQYWDYANRCQENFEDSIKINEINRERGIPSVVKSLFWVVTLFCATFIFSLIWIWVCILCNG